MIYIYVARNIFKLSKEFAFDSFMFTTKKNSTAIYKVLPGISFVMLIYSKLAYSSIIRNSLCFMPLK